MADDPLFTTTLADADKYIYRAECKSCHRAINVDLAKLAQSLGPDFPVRELRHRLKCDFCHSKAPIIAFVLREGTVGREYSEKAETKPLSMVK